MSYYIIWFLLNVILVTYVSIVNYKFELALKLDCARKLMVWLAFYNTIATLHLIRTLTLVCIWCCANDPAMSHIKLEVFYGVWVFLFEIAWLVYGNTFIYDDKIQDCDDEIEAKGIEVNVNTNALWATALALIIYGYLLFVAVILTILFYIGAYMGYQAYVKEDRASLEHQNQAQNF